MSRNLHTHSAYIPHCVIQSYTYYMQLTNIGYGPTVRKYKQVYGRKSNNTALNVGNLRLVELFHEVLYYGDCAEPSLF